MHRPSNRIISVVALALFLALSLALPIATVSAGDEGADKVVFVDEPLAPYSLGEMGGLAQGGISYDLLAGIFGRLGMDFELRLVPWARVLKTVEHGKADGVPLLVKNAEREAYLVYTDPVVEIRDLLYYLPERLGRFQWEEYADLKGRSFALTTGYAYDEGFMSALEAFDFQVIRSRDTEANVRLLLAGRADLILEEESMMATLLAEHPEWESRISAAAKPVSSYFWYMGISRLSPLAGRVDEINQVLSDMREDGSLDVILENR